jgi:hypothetical protein
MVARALSFLSVAVLVASLGGCGKSEGSAEAIPRDELPERIASLLCESVAGCCRSAGLAVDLAACKIGTTAELREDFDDDDTTRVSYDGQAAGECLAAAAPLFVCGEADGPAPPACERIFHGSVPLGEDCGGDRECARSEGQSVVCDYGADGLLPMRCTALPVSPHGKQGEACIGTCEGANCIGVLPPDPAPGVGGGAPVPLPDPVTCYRDEGLYCDSSGVCAPLLQVGDACNDYAACAGDGFCDSATQVCRAPRGNGQPCSGDDECQSGVCVRPSDIEPNGTCSATGITAEQCANPF